MPLIFQNESKRFVSFSCSNNFSMTANVKCIGLPFNKGDFYENHVAGPHPPDIFRGEMVVIVVVPNN